MLRRELDGPVAAEEPRENIDEEEVGGAGGAPLPADCRGETLCSLSKKLMLSLSSRRPRPPLLPPVPRPPPVP